MSVIIMHPKHNLETKYKNGWNGEGGGGGGGVRVGWGGGQGGFAFPLQQLLQG